MEWARRFIIANTLPVFHGAPTIGASYRYQDKYLFRLNIENPLDDKGYIMIAGGRVSGTGITTAPGINVKFSTTVNF